MAVVALITYHFWWNLRPYGSIVEFCSRHYRVLTAGCCSYDSETHEIQHLLFQCVLVNSKPKLQDSGLPTSQNQAAGREILTLKA